LGLSGAPFLFLASL